MDGLTDGGMDKAGSRVEVETPTSVKSNKAGYTATLVACGWAGAIIEVSGAFGQ